MLTQNNEQSKVMDIVMRERRLAVSDREWKHRLRGYGYAIRDTDEGRIVASLLKGQDICGLPAHLVH
ncbi:hypothetical protein ACM25N_16105 [Roseovarius sp. C7]|uniref:hypothetical protein n=1 Tax=Roseovarius sp. C7 TaxID=3398643 RepID=UPI0039F6B179